MRFDNVGLFWQDLPATRGSSRILGPMPPIPETGWLPPREYPTILHAPWISIDTEAYDPELNEFGPGWARGKAHMVGFSVAVPGNKWYFPIRHEVQRELNMDPVASCRWLNYSLSQNQPKIGANILYDIGLLRSEGVAVNGPLYDVQYAEALLDETAALSLEDLGWRHLQRGKTSEALKEWIIDYYRPPVTKWRREIYRSPVTLTGPYAEDDAAMPYEILMKQWPQLVSRGLMDLFEMECKQIKMLLDMRYAGVSVDIPYAEKLREDLLIEENKITKEAEDMCGMGISLDAAASLAPAFDKLGIPYPRTQPTENAPLGNPSFRKDWLKIQAHPFPKLITRGRELKKLRGTFVEGYILESSIPVGSSNSDRKIYCSFHPLMGEEGGAKTGRYASSDPNLQNIPTRTKEGKMVRQAFIMDQGHYKFRSHDHSQIEYRMLAHFATGAGSEEVRQKYREDPNTDYHDFVGEIMYQITGERFDRKNVLKNLNFGIVYGVGKDHLAELMGKTVAETIQVLKQFNIAIPFAKATMKSISEEVGYTGICTTILGRQTHFDLWEPAGYDHDKDALPYLQAVEEYGYNIVRAYLFRAINYRLQGSAADVLKKGMVNCWEKGIFHVTGVPRMPVHDELTFSDPGNVPPDAWEAMQYEMEHCLDDRLSVPLRFDGKLGDNWAECK